MELPTKPFSVDAFAAQVDRLLGNYPFSLTLLTAAWDSW